MQLVMVILTVFLEFLILKNILSVNLKEYQGFSTRFYSSSRDNSISTNSIIFWIFVSPVFSCLAYLIIFLINSKIDHNNIAYDKLWLVSTIFWLFNYLIILILGRIRLVNHLFVFFIASSSIFLNWYLSVIAYTGDIRDLLPNANNTTFQFYLVMAVFLVSAIQVIYERENYDLKRNRFILKKFNTYLSNFKVLSELEGELLYLAISILLVEDFERPKFVRFFENCVGTRTRNIAQNDSLDDNHSVFLLVKHIQNEECNQKKSDKNLDIRGIVMSYNHSNQYADDIYKIFCEIDRLDREYKIVDSYKS